jgi:hypothetical protein
LNSTPNFQLCDGENTKNRLIHGRKYKVGLFVSSSVAARAVSVSLDAGRSLAQPWDERRHKLLRLQKLAENAQGQQLACSCLTFQGFISFPIDLFQRQN